LTFVLSQAETASNVRNTLNQGTLWAILNHDKTQRAENPLKSRQQLKTKNMKKINLIIALIGINIINVLGQNIENGLIAHYPLYNNAVDKTGLQGNIMLQNNPIPDEGSYCTGVYYDKTALNENTITNSLKSFDYKNFTLSVEFKVSELEYHWVFVLGRGSREVGFLLNSDGTIELTGLNQDIIEQTNEKYIVNNWYLATITYNNGTAKIYLDNQLIGEENFNFRAYDCEFTTTNFSNGTAFKGWIKNIKIYNRTLSDNEIEILFEQSDIRKKIIKPVKCKFFVSKFKCFRKW
jgi:hypothetical protein